MRHASLLLILCASALAQAPDPALLKYVEGIPAIDDHAHVVAPDMARDKGYDALRCDQLPGTALPMANTRFGPDVQAAWKALYGVVPSSAEDAERRLPQVQGVVRQQKGSGYFDWVLQQAGIDVVLANRTAMAGELKPPHFRWVPYDDALLFPLDNATLKALNPDRRALFDMEEALLKQYFAAAGVSGLPRSLADYVEHVVRPTLQKQKAGGAVAIKFEAAYLRSLDFAPVSEEVANRAYSHHSGEMALDEHDYKLVQDYLFRTIAAEAGKLGLVVQIHTGAGCGEFFDDRGADPMNLVSVLNDPALRSTSFVLLHGGTPFNREITSLIVKPNAYVDTSVLELLFSPAELANILRPWLEFMPEHVLFGTDAGPFGPGMGWEESAWLGSRNARQAIAIVMTRMVQDGTITPGRAKEIAEGILHSNAARLYHLQ